jgi:outer membrane scaffolding protein for murein synthesis (MipA/OmpV family)
LRGLDNIDAALELGLGLGYDEEYWRVFGDVRYGAVGHSAWVGEFGADAILRPNDQLIVNFGPRASWGNSRFIDTYFGVTEKESDRSGIRDYDASAGFYGVGAELGARYAFSENWGVEGRAGYSRLIGDAGDSPITDIGSPNQFELQVLITRSIGLGF